MDESKQSMLHNLPTNLFSTNTVYNSKDCYVSNSRNENPFINLLNEKGVNPKLLCFSNCKKYEKICGKKKNNNVPEMIINLLWLMRSTGVYKAARIQYLRRHADKLHPISVWNPCAFVLVCVRVLRCFIWFSAQSYPIITVCAQPMNTLPFALLIQMYVRKSGCLWRTEGGASTKQRAPRQKMWANLPCWHGRIHFNYKCPPQLGKDETQQPSTKWSVGKEGGCST